LSCTTNEFLVPLLGLELNKRVLRGPANSPKTGGRQALTLLPLPLPMVTPGGLRPCSPASSKHLGLLTDRRDEVDPRALLSSLLPRGLLLLGLLADRRDDADSRALLSYTTNEPLVPLIGLELNKRVPRGPANSPKTGGRQALTLLPLPLPVVTPGGLRPCSPASSTHRVARPGGARPWHFSAATISTAGRGAACAWPTTLVARRACRSAPPAPFARRRRR
jgi:hypothetical protein